MLSLNGLIEAGRRRRAKAATRGRGSSAGRCAASQPSEREGQAWRSKICCRPLGGGGTLTRGCRGRNSDPQAWQLVRRGCEWSPPGWPACMREIEMPRAHHPQHVAASPGRRVLQGRTPVCRLAQASGGPRRTSNPGASARTPSAICESVGSGKRDARRPKPLVPRDRGDIRRRHGLKAIIRRRGVVGESNAAVHERAIERPEASPSRTSSIFCTRKGCGREDAARSPFCSVASRGRPRRFVPPKKVLVGGQRPLFAFDETPSSSACDAGPRGSFTHVRLRAGPFDLQTGLRAAHNASTCRTWTRRPSRRFRPAKPRV